MKPPTEQVRNDLQRNGIRPSFQRIKVLEYLRARSGHPTAEEVYAVLSHEAPYLSKATVYNTLHLLVSVGLARTLQIDDTELRYDVTLHNHGHFRCDDCGTIVDFAVNPDAWPVAELAHYSIRAKDVFFIGLCPKCLGRKGERATKREA